MRDSDAVLLTALAFAIISVALAVGQLFAVDHNVVLIFRGALVVMLVCSLWLYFIARAYARTEARDARR